MFKKIFRKRIEDIFEMFKDKNILISDKMANFFGQESLGVWEVRGNGVLLLTEQELFFGMWKPKKDMIFPVKSIIEITNPKSHMHRSVFKSLLKISFKNESGEHDSAAWFVGDLNKWNQILGELTSGTG